MPITNKSSEISNLMWKFYLLHLITLEKGKDKMEQKWRMAYLAACIHYYIAKYLRIMR
jgi:hypothetical protein